MTPCEKLGYKAGDKFRVVSDDTLFTNGSIVELYSDDCSRAPCFKGDTQGVYHCAGQDEGAYMHLDNVVKIDGETAEFLKTQPWFIHTGTSERSRAAQEWLFSHGMTWFTKDNVIRQYGEKILTNTYAGDDACEHIMWSSSTQPSASAKEIYLTTQVVITGFTLPEVKTAQQLKIEELEVTIKQAQEQIAALKLG